MKKKQTLSLKQTLRQCEASKLDYQGGFKKILRKRNITDIHQSDLITKKSEKKKIDTNSMFNLCLLYFSF